MSKELVKTDMTQLPAIGLGVGSELFSDLTANQAFVDRIQLFTKGKAVDQGKITPGHYGIPTGDEVQDLGAEIDVIPLVCRPKAIDMRDRDAVVVSYDPSTELFQSINTMAPEKDSGCMVGVTFLMFERSLGKFFEFFCGNKSSLLEAPKIGAFLPRTPEQEAELEQKLGKKPAPTGPCTLKSKYVTKGSWGWHVPVCVQCSTPFTNFSTDLATKEITRFMLQEASQIEKAEETASSKRAR